MEDNMKKKISGIALAFFVLGVNFVSAIDIFTLAESLREGVSLSGSAVTESKSWKNAEEAERGWDKISSRINQAESAVQDAENYESVNGSGSLNSFYQGQVNQIKANLRQVRNKMSAFGISTSWAIDL
jgi:hypothetical protein